MTPPDAPKDIGFNKPTAALKANMELSENNWMELGPADLTCLDTPSADMATTVAVMLTTKVTDFQSGNPVPGASVTLFGGQDLTQVFPGSPFTADGNAMVTVQIPVGTKRFGYKMTHASSLDTLLLNQIADPTNPTQTVGEISAVSNTTATTLSAFIGVSRTAGTGVLAGAMRDCQEREVSNFVATVSSVKGAPTHVPGADTYYFAKATGLPARHNQQPRASENGLFMVIELEAAPKAYVQVWGYKTDADLAADNLSLVAELETAVIADTVITGSYEPLRQ